MQMSRNFVALVRHGHYEQAPNVPSAHLPHPLTPLGRDQARALAEHLLQVASELGATLHPTIHTSSLLRAYETASLAATRLAQASAELCPRIETSDALVERSLGAAANLTVAEIEAIVERDPRYSPLPDGWKSSRHIRLPFVGAESLAQAGARVAAYISRTVEEVGKQATLPTLTVFVAHGAALRHAAFEFGVLSLEETRRYSMHHALPIILERHDWEGWSHMSGSWKERHRTND
jgi:2,3-bisphosphoglycerate-dependent phosphoglycerate mutase